MTNLPVRRYRLGALLIVAAAILVSARPASADVILGAIAGTIESGGPGFGTLTETFDQSGLLSPYISGVTDFDAYLGTGPLHDLVFSGNEWFSNSATSGATVTYDLGAVHTIGRVALWNEDISGIGLLSLSGSQDGVSFADLALDLTPTNNPVDFDYGADVFGFNPAAIRYIRFDMNGCPQPEPGAFPACGIGEVAFAEVAAVPEPASAALLGLGLAAVAAIRRRRTTR